MNIDISKNDDGSYLSYDNGAAFDKATCSCSFILPYTQAYNLSNFLRTYRDEVYTLTMDSTDGFYPFHPQHGKVGPFVVSCQIKSSLGQLAEPWKYYRFDLIFTNTGSFPAEAGAPSLNPEGSLSIAGVYGLRCPDNLFPTKNEISRYSTFDEQSHPYLSSRPADQAIVTLDLKLSYNNAFCLCKQLIESARTTLFHLVLPSNRGCYIFGEYYGQGGNFSVLLIQDTIELTHEELNLFSMKITLWNIGAETSPAQNGGSPMILYASQLPGVNNNSNVNTGGGTDDTTVINNALTYLGAQGGGILYVDGQFLIGTNQIGLQIPPNVRIIGIAKNTCGFYMASGGNVIPIRNLHRCKNYSSLVVSASGGTVTGSTAYITVTSGTGQLFDPPQFPYYVTVGTEYMLVMSIAGDVLTVERNSVPVGSGIQTSLVTIAFGNTIAQTPVDVNIELSNLTVNGNGANNVGAINESNSDYPSQIVANCGQSCAVYFHGVIGLTMNNIEIVNSVGFACGLANITKFKSTGYHAIQTPLRGGNFDGIHMWGPMNNVRIKDMLIETEDDGFAMNLGENLVLNGTSLGWSNYCSNGGAQDFFVDGLRIGGGNGGIRVFGHPAYLIDNVEFKNVTFLNNNQGYVQASYPNKRILINNASNIGQIAFDNIHDLTGLGINIIVDEASGDFFGGIAKMIVRNCNFNNSFSAGNPPYSGNNLNYSYCPICIDAPALIGELMFVNCDMGRTNTGIFAYIAGIIALLSMHDCKMFNVSSIISIGAGRPNNTPYGVGNNGQNYGLVTLIEFKGMKNISVSSLIATSGGAGSPTVMSNSETTV